MGCPSPPAGTERPGPWSFSENPLWMLTTALGNPIFNAMYLVVDETAQEGIPGGKGAGKPWGQLSGGDAGADGGPSGGMLLRVPFHIPVNRA